MTYEEMQAIEARVFEQIRRIRESKGREYAHDADTLADFKEVAAEAGVTPLQCWLTYVQKHQRAVSTFVREGAVKSESIESRVVDVIAYHILLLGLVEDLKGPPLDALSRAPEAPEAGDSSVRDAARRLAETTDHGELVAAVGEFEQAEVEWYNDLPRDSQARPTGAGA